MSFIIREGTKDDCYEVEKLIQELADYEKMPNGPKIDAATLIKDGGFLEENPQKFFHLFVAETTSTKQIIGYTLYYYIYSTWEGKAIWMEDLYVQPQHRGTGVGSRLWQAVAVRARDENCSRLDFNVLDWNKSSIGYYEKNGAVNITTEQGWHIFRLQRDAISNLANKHNPKS